MHLLPTGTYIIPEKLKRRCFLAAYEIGDKVAYGMNKIPMKIMGAAYDWSDESWMYATVTRDMSEKAPFLVIPEADLDFDHNWRTVWKELEVVALGEASKAVVQCDENKEARGLRHGEPQATRAKGKHSAALVDEGADEQAVTDVASDEEQGPPPPYTACAEAEHGLGDGSWRSAEKT